MIKFLKNEQKEINNNIKTKFSKIQLREAQILVKTGWKTALLRLKQLKKDLKNASSFDDFYWWKEEVETIEDIIKDKRNQYKSLLMEFE